MRRDEIWIKKRNVHYSQIYVHFGSGRIGCEVSIDTISFLTLHMVIHLYSPA